ncbi:hypothetical protein ACRCQH_30470, partial [Pseudomonas aeruginosa]
MRLALRPLRRLSLAAGLAALATLGACSILPEAQVLQVYLLPVHNPPASAAAGGGGRGGASAWLRRGGLACLALTPLLFALFLGSLLLGS